MEHLRHVAIEKKIVNYVFLEENRFYMEGLWSYYRNYLICMIHSLASFAVRSDTRLMLMYLFRCVSVDRDVV